MNASRLSRISAFLGLQRSTVGLLCMVILVGTGERMAERFLPIYLMAFGGGVLSIGVLNGLCLGIWGERNGVRIAFVFALALALRGGDLNS